MPDWSMNRKTPTQASMCLQDRMRLLMQVSTPVLASSRVLNRLVFLPTSEGPLSGKERRATWERSQPKPASSPRLQVDRGLFFHVRPLALVLRASLQPRNQIAEGSSLSRTPAAVWHLLPSVAVLFAPSREPSKPTVVPQLTPSTAKMMSGSLRAPIRGAAGGAGGASSTTGADAASAASAAAIGMGNGMPAGCPWAPSLGCGGSSTSLSKANQGSKSSATPLLLHSLSPESPPQSSEFVLFSASCSISSGCSSSPALLMKRRRRVVSISAGPAQNTTSDTGATSTYSCGGQRRARARQTEDAQ